MHGGGRTQEKEREDKVGRYRTYRNDKELRKAVEAYFRSISRTVTVQEQYNTGEKDGWGHFIYALRDVKNDDGEKVRRREYAVPPTEAGLIDYLGISRDTWRRYCDPEKNPQFTLTVRYAQDQLIGYLEQELLIRPAKTLKGVETTLEMLYDKTRKVEIVERGGAGVKAEDMDRDRRQALLEEVSRRYG